MDHDHLDMLPECVFFYAIGDWDINHYLVDSWWTISIWYLVSTKHGGCVND